MAATLIFHKTYVTIVGCVQLRNARELARDKKEETKKNNRESLRGFTTVARRIASGLLQFPDTHVCTCSYR